MLTGSGLDIITKKLQDIFQESNEWAMETYHLQVAAANRPAVDEIVDVVSIRVELPCLKVAGPLLPQLKWPDDDSA